MAILWIDGQVRVVDGFKARGAGKLDESVHTAGLFAAQQPFGVKVFHFRGEPGLKSLSVEGCDRPDA